MKIIFRFVKRLVLSSFLLYGYNMLAQPLNLIVPINIYTVLSISILGVPALVSFILILIIVY